jgi:hypothetical protein
MVSIFNALRVVGECYTTGGVVELELEGLIRSPKFILKNLLTLRAMRVLFKPSAQRGRRASGTGAGEIK